MCEQVAMSCEKVLRAEWHMLRPRAGSLSGASGPPERIGNVCFPEACSNLICRKGIFTGPVERSPLFLTITTSLFFVHISCLTSCVYRYWDKLAIENDPP